MRRFLYRQRQEDSKPLAIESQDKITIPNKVDTKTFVQGKAQANDHHT